MSFRVFLYLYRSKLSAYSIESWSCVTMNQLLYDLFEVLGLMTLLAMLILS